MPDDVKDKGQPAEAKPRTPVPPLIFISHDSRDAELAEAFSALLRRVSAGMLKSFRSSDKKGTDGIEFGDEWYKRLMGKLDSASDVVCLLTERSFQRPWILYEAGVTKGKLDKPVLGVALGISLSKVSTGPFYQFQNCDDSEEALSKLIMQLAGRIPALEPDPDVVVAQVQAFKTEADALLIQLGQADAEAEDGETASESSTARLLEELKVIVRELPRQIHSRLADDPLPDQRRGMRRYHPELFREMTHMLHLGPEDPLGILVITSFFRDDAPWLYELGREAYNSIHSRDEERHGRALAALRRAFEMIRHSSQGPELFGGSEEAYMMLRDAQEFLARYIS